MARKKIVVTGGAGFIGGNFVHYMVDKYPQYDIYNLDLLTYAGDLTKHKPIETKENYHFVRADIADRKTILALFEEEKFDYVIHFAAESHVDRSIKDPGVFVQTNVVGTHGHRDRNTVHFLQTLPKVSCNIKMLTKSGYG